MKSTISILLLLFIVSIVVAVDNGCESYMNYPAVTIDKSVYTTSTTNSVYVLYVNGGYLAISQQAAGSQATPSNTIIQASFSDDIATTGWGRLNVTSFGVVNDDCLQTYLGGYVEGIMTAERINQMYTNFAAGEFKNSTPSATLLSFMSAQLAWVRKGVAMLESDSQPDLTHPFNLDDDDQSFGEYSYSINSTIYWHSVKLIMAQFDGIVGGYQASTFGQSNVMSQMQLYLLTSAGDLQTLNTLYGEPAVESKSGRMQKHLFNGFQDMDGYDDDIDFLDCSALVRLLPGNQDAYFAHTTWRYYYGMMRIYKFYNFALQQFKLSYHVSFSSSPGFLSSKDDFYMTGANLAVMETTNNIYNETLYMFVLPETLLVWQRAVISNILAQSAPSWALTFQQYNSGTYNNQWMIFDYKLFSPSQSLPDNTFWVLEQIPGYCEMQDMSQILDKNQVWPSYNIPYFEEIYNISGYPAMQQKYGDSYSYQSCPRALIFGRNATDIQTFEGMQEMMQYNYYKYDPLSLGSPSNSISSRADLLPNPVAFGGVDSKITSSQLIQTLSCSAISGPTHQGLPYFQYSSNPIFNSTSHIGLPDIWNFDWVSF
ncbi:phospholipase B-like protein [Cavenderia fasciculata]|uniref:Phospholipase B-like n=1 Tax=Cavenderia fasciculata TaxID=261658 RepID=F4Q3G0_CACFS|nr:phospholipase B-like protein [Cavenderia fasciculata]EGG16829.1 phospholipase B-like protein [Cavenderia fasciculata]|eukprot:XP_004355303.1 phospholipase B-like protein [Cavenderia fasciculata]